MSQPSWVFLENLGDKSPLEHGGYFLYEDATGVYPPEAEVLEVNEATDEITIYRFSLDRCYSVNGALCDHREMRHRAWFAQSEDQKRSRPQDTTYLSRVADFAGVSLESMISGLCSDCPTERARAYWSIGCYHGWENFDSYPLKLTRGEAVARYRELHVDGERPAQRAGGNA